MIEIKGSDYSSDIIWLGLIEGYLHSPTATLSSKNIKSIIRTCEKLQDALADELPATASVLKFIQNELRATTTHPKVRSRLNQFRTTLHAESGKFKILIISHKEATPVLQGPQKTVAITSTLNKGGRPSKSWWEDCIIEISRQIYLGELKPKRQADVAKAMHEWIASNDYEVGETQVKQRARKVFDALVI